MICTYRPPDDKVRSFCERLELIVSDLRQRPNVELTVIGDVNIDLFRNNNSVKKYKSCLRCLGLSNLIKVNTHVNVEKQAEN